MTTYSILGDKEKGLHTLTRNRMIEKGLWSHSPDGMFSTSGDNESLKEVCSSMSNYGLKTGNTDLVGSEVCADDSIMCDKCATEDNNVYYFPLNYMMEADDDISFFNTHHEDKENSDLFYYGWGDIGNFDDVDRMFRSCDSTFGLGSLSNEDDFCWFSSSQVTEGSQDAFKADAKLNGIPQHCASSRPDNEVSSTIDSSKKSVHPSDKIDSSNMKGDNSGFAHLSYLNVSNEESASKDELTPKEQISPPKKQVKQLSASGERKDKHLKNGSSFHEYGNIKQSTYVKNTFSELCCQFFSPSGLQQHKQSVGPDSLSYARTNIPYMHLNDFSPLDHILECPTLSSTKSENNGNPSSTNEPSYASDQVQSIESFTGPSFGASDITMNEKNGNLHYPQDTQAPLKRNVKPAKVGSKMAFYDPVTVQEQVHQSEQDGHSEVQGASVGKPEELDSSNDQLSSCTSSVLDEVSLEASGFWMLQQVMEKLDIRTKLCIWDSLYRLARSAEQRHNCTDMKGDIKDEKYVVDSFVAKEPNKYIGLMDVETGTNPIDRSIAHLLFHRPSVNTKSHGMIHGSIM
ncbi:Dentin sialophosphoprotein-related, putative isoform 5 [Hibiscus syriacus]|uniref:Dentin sialophosphoprotein-related, putative isoform 5 n=1 Tax=Hibiscus syriacus TaxID=106335 RepID=A0A6A2XP31_HIBSY|nr:protein LNK1-like [Hibiscus syriacus]KAE8663776.1 Dentin sialophosphoprotein-related, putative isoform 5 [Hibiscus syriacus]